MLQQCIACGYDHRGCLLLKLVTKEWHVLTLRIEEQPPNTEGSYISSRGQPTRGGPPAWEFGEVLTTPRRKKVTMLRIKHRCLERRAVVNEVMNLRFHKMRVFLE